MVDTQDLKSCGQCGCAGSSPAPGTTENTKALQNKRCKAFPPMLAGETYHLKVRFFDKNKKENEIVAEVDLITIN